jgi:hypothetical protein
VADVPSGLSVTPPPRNCKSNYLPFAILVASGGMVTDEFEAEGSGRGLIEVISRYLLGRE